MKKIKHNLRFFLILTAASVALFFTSALLHNLIDALFGLEEAFFFLIAVIVCPVGFVVGVVGSVVILIKGIIKKQ